MSRIGLTILGLMSVLIISAVGSASASAAHVWLVNGVEAHGQGVLGLGKTLTFTAGTKVIECKHIHSMGTVGLGGTGLATSIHFLECATNEAGCVPLTAGALPGLLRLLNIPTLLTLRENSNGAKEIADEFKENPTTKEWGTLKFHGTCTTFPESKLTGNYAALVENGTESLNFPSPELKGNTLKFFGLAAKFVLKIKQSLTAGGVLTAD